jgi:cysteine desulfurase
MGISDEDARRSIRISIGRFTSDDDVNNAVDHIRKIYTELNQTQSI